MTTTSTTVHTSRLFSPTKKSFLSNISITIDLAAGLITSIYQRASHDIPDPPASTATTSLDLRHLTILPGLVDAHTHIFLHPYSITPPLNQMRDESAVERVLRAANHLRAAISAGYTTYRDLGTEGLGDADVGVRDAVNRGIVPAAPRLYVATDPIASSGGYEAIVENGRDGVPRLADSADGVEGVRAAVRRRLAAGADVVKIYVDYRRRARRWPQSTWTGCPAIQFPPPTDRLGGQRNPNLPLWTGEEVDEIVREAERGDAPVAAHCMRGDSVLTAVRAGVTSVEHGFMLDDDVLREMQQGGTIWVPTLSVFDLFYRDKMPDILARVHRGWELGVKIACGGDTGPFAHGDNVRELELMLQAGIPLEEVLTAATLHGWEACGGDRAGRKFGRLEEGCAADIIALDGDPREDVGALRKVTFVMKDGQVYKMDGLVKDFGLRI